MRDRLHFLFLNIGHFVDHYATLIFATAVMSRVGGTEIVTGWPFLFPRKSFFMLSFPETKGA